MHIYVYIMYHAYMYVSIYIYICIATGAILSATVHLRIIHTNTTVLLTWWLNCYGKMFLMDPAKIYIRNQKGDCEGHALYRNRKNITELYFYEQKT